MVNEIAEIERDGADLSRGERVHPSMLQRNAAKTKPITTADKRIEEPVAEPVWTIPGFGAGARVQTSFGFVPVEVLRIGDPIKTRTGRFLKVKYVDEIRLDRRFLLTHPEAQPITIPKDAFDTSVPGKNICVSGAQEVWQPGRFDQRQATAAAKLIGQGRVFRNLNGYFNYYVFHCFEPCTACIDGLWVNIKPTTPDISID
ncbi:Hint domain-containing protein [Falsihalocynthiibacter arcticus]|uniref:Hedgehog/Intein (Hint) domain-containing protein n=1 Tax=Falsihalocynthiibacter arcticus TaxID=1579316 RepID=A0A126V2M2_9RHOB|nr:Hint domain-containing protein [Falsihalocynthiibacter arcticus]AML52578.1 hypothetical protein RC74_16045 [Falsihalocynthiibacter arcticus]